MRNREVAMLKLDCLVTLDGAHIDTEEKVCIYCVLIYMYIGNIHSCCIHTVCVYVAVLKVCIQYECIQYECSYVSYIFVYTNVLNCIYFFVYYTYYTDHSRYTSRRSWCEVLAIVVYMHICTYMCVLLHNLALSLCIYICNYLSSVYVIIYQIIRSRGSWRFSYRKVVILISNKPSSAIEWEHLWVARID